MSASTDYYWHKGQLSSTEYYVAVKSKAGTVASGNAILVVVVDLDQLLDTSSKRKCCFKLLRFHE